MNIDPAFRPMVRTAYVYYSSSAVIFFVSFTRGCPKWITSWNPRAINCGFASQKFSGSKYLLDDLIGLFVFKLLFYLLFFKCFLHSYNLLNKRFWTKFSGVLWTEWRRFVFVMLNSCRQAGVSASDFIKFHPPVPMTIPHSGMSGATPARCRWIRLGGVGAQQGIKFSLKE